MSAFKHVMSAEKFLSLKLDRTLQSQSKPMLFFISSKALFLKFPPIADFALKSNFLGN